VTLLFQPPAVVRGLEFLTKFFQSQRHISKNTRSAATKNYSSTKKWQIVQAASKKTMAHQQAAGSLGKQQHIFNQVRC